MERILVVGGGTMGAGIAVVAARGGYAVEIVEPQTAARERAAVLFEREGQRGGDAGIAQLRRVARRNPERERSRDRN